MTRTRLTPHPFSQRLSHAADTDVAVRRGQACSGAVSGGVQARLARGREFAPTLVGLDRDVAVQQVAENGYQAEVIPATAEAVTLDLDSRRIRLFLDERNVVVRASAG